LKKIILLLVFIPFLNSYGMTKDDVLKTWKEVHIAFYEELLKNDEHIRTVWSDEIGDKIISISKNQPRSIFLSNELFEYPQLEKRHLYMLFCHELGHILGGAPYFLEYPGDNRKLSGEGQADYFATKRCMGRLLAPSKIEEIQQSVTAKESMALHARGCKSKKCQSVSQVAKETLEILGDEVSFFARENEIVQFTNPYQNSAQCRLDTFIAGAVSLNNMGYYMAFQFDYVDYNGSRPKCWYSPFDTISI